MVVVLDAVGLVGIMVSAAPAAANPTPAVVACIILFVALVYAFLVEVLTGPGVLFLTPPAAPLFTNPAPEGCKWDVVVPLRRLRLGTPSASSLPTLPATRPVRPAKPDTNRPIPLNITIVPQQIKVCCRLLVT